MASLWTPPSFRSLKTVREARSTTEYEPVEKSEVSTKATFAVGKGLVGADTRRSPLAVVSRSVLSLRLTSQGSIGIGEAIFGPMPVEKVLRSKRNVQEPRVTVPLAVLPPESKVTGPTLVPPKLANCRVNACPCGSPSIVARLAPAPVGNAKDRLFRSLAVAETNVVLLPLLHPRTASAPMTAIRAIHKAMGRSRRSS